MPRIVNESIYIRDEVSLDVVFIVGDNLCRHIFECSTWAIIVEGIKDAFNLTASSEGDLPFVDSSQMVLTTALINGLSNFSSTLSQQQVKCVNHDLSGLLLAR